MQTFRYNTILLKSGVAQHHVRNMRRTRKEHGAGFTLVETLVAITVLLVAIVGPMTIASQGLQASFFSREQTTAVFLAQEAVEAIEQKRNEAALAAIYDIGEREHLLCQHNLIGEGSGLSSGDPLYEQYGDDFDCVGESWAWYENVPGECKTDSETALYKGCDYNMLHDGDPSTNDEFIVCEEEEDCTLWVDASNSSGRYYHHNETGNLSPYTRVITFEEVTASQEVKVTVEVSWQATLFGGTDSSVVLQTRLFDQYE